jgi:hypothetical protein
VFYPINDKIETTIKNNAHLLIEDKIPNVFLQLVSYTESQKATIDEWNSGAITSAMPEYLTPRINEPLVSEPNCIKEQFDYLKAVQNKLQTSVWETICNLLGGSEAVPSCENVPRTNLVDRVGS